MINVKWKEDFRSFKDGVDVSDEEIQKWINECVSEMQKNSLMNYVRHQSGNTLVIAIRTNNGHSYDDIDIFVSKNYSEATIMNAYSNEEQIIL